MEQIRKRIGGKEYTLQMIPADHYFKIVDSCKDENGNVVTGKYYKELCGSVVVRPRFNMSDFDGKISALRALHRECEKFVLGDDIEVEDVEESKNEQPAAEQIESVSGGFTGDQLPMGYYPPQTQTNFPTQN